MDYVEVGRQRQASPAHPGPAESGAETPEEAPGAAGGGEDTHGQHRFHPFLRQI